MAYASLLSKDLGSGILSLKQRIDYRLWVYRI